MDESGGLMSISENIRKLRKRLGYKQEQVAVFLGISYDVLSGYENGTTQVPVDKLEKIADLFGVELRDLLSKDENINDATIASTFITDEVTTEDINSIADFQRIVKSHQKMLKIAKRKSLDSN